MLKIKHTYDIKIFWISEELKRILRVNIEYGYEPINMEECLRILKVCKYVFEFLCWLRLSGCTSWGSH